MSQITRVPRGLQDFLGNQNFGQNPQEFGQVVLPVLDIGGFYTADKLQFYIGETIEPIVLGDDVLDVTVPTGKLWIVESFGVSVNSSSSDPPFVLVVSPRLRNIALKSGPFTNDYIGAGDALEISAGSEIVGFTRQTELPRPLILTGNTTLQFRVSQVSGGVTSLKCWFRYFDLDA